MDIIKNRKHGIYKYKLNKNGKINSYSNNYNQEIGIKGVIIKYYNFDYIKFPPNLIKKNNSSKNILGHNLNLLLLYSYFIKNKNLYYINNDNNKDYKFIFLKNNMDNIIKYLYIKTRILENKKIFISNDYDINNNIIKLIFGYIYLLLLHNKKYTKDNEIYIKLFYQYYLNIISIEIYLLYNKKYADFANYRVLYDFLKKKGYIDTFYKKLVPVIKNNYKKVLNNIDFSGMKEFKKKIYKEMKPFSKININKIINQYYPNKKENKIIKDKLKELMKKINV
jgi:hypothetical protein